MELLQEEPSLIYPAHTHTHTMHARLVGVIPLEQARTARDTGDIKVVYITLVLRKIWVRCLPLTTGCCPAAALRGIISLSQSWLAGKTISIHISSVPPSIPATCSRHHLIWVACWDNSLISLQKQAMQQFPYVNSVSLWDTAAPKLSETESFDSQAS